MSIKRKIKSIIINTNDEIKSFVMHRSEIKKYEDPRRVEIYSSIELSEEQKKTIDNFYIENYGKKIPYTWHQHFTAFTGKFDVKYIPELIYIPEFEKYENMYTEYVASLEDKNFLPIIAKGVGVKTTKTIVSCTKGVFRDENYQIISKDKLIEILSNIGNVFCKPTVDTGSGVGCFVMNVKNKVDLLSNKQLGQIIEDLGTDFSIQERLVCHSSIRNIYPDGVNTFRIFTYRWRDKIEHFPSIMRIGKDGNVLDNAHAGGMFIGVHDDGQLEDRAFTEFHIVFEEHPNTKVKFSNVKIELFPKVLEAAIKMHEAMPQIGSINWDFTINDYGEPVLIEANVMGGSIWLSEMANGCGAFGDKTAEVLQWLQLMNKTKETERHYYNFGYLTKQK